MKNIKFLYALLAVVFLASCEEDLEVIPVDRIGTNTVITDAASAETAILGVYSSLQGGGLWGNLGITGTGTLSDEGIHSGSFPTVSEMDNNEIFATNVTVRGYWNGIHSGLFRANFVLERLGDVDLTAALASQYEGEARFLRALFHFLGTNLYGDFSIAQSSVLAELEVLPRSAPSAVYAAIEADLNAAITLLNGVSFGANEARVRATPNAARALLARVQLYQGNLAAAGATANEVITNGGFALEANYGDVFSGASNEVIMQVFASVNDQNGIAFQYQPAANGGRLEHAASQAIVDAYPAGDTRAAYNLAADVTIPSGFHVNKYRDAGNGTDNPVIFRLAEMYLIRAEANLGTAQADADINMLRARAGLAPLAAAATLDDVMNERMLELAFEGHRWFDLKRTGRVDAVMSLINPQTWQSTDALMPIHPEDVTINPNLNQNPGY